MRSKEAFAPDIIHCQRLDDIGAVNAELWSGWREIGPSCAYSGVTVTGAPPWHTTKVVRLSVRHQLLCLFGVPVRFRLEALFTRGPAACSHQPTVAGAKGGDNDIKRDARRSVEWGRIAEAFSKVDGKILLEIEAEYMPAVVEVSQPY